MTNEAEGELWVWDGVGNKRLNASVITNIEWSKMGRNKFRKGKGEILIKSILAYFSHANKMSSINENGNIKIIF